MGKKMISRKIVHGVLAFTFAIGTVSANAIAADPLAGAPAATGAAAPTGELSSALQRAGVGERRKGWDFTEARLIPIQSGGRLKPLDSFAREAILFTTGKRTFSGWEPIDMLFSWITFPAHWENEAFIQVNRIDVRRQLGLDENRTRFTPRELIRNSALAQYADGIQKGQTGAEPPGMPTRSQPRQQELRSVLERVGLFREMVSGEGWLLVPRAAPSAWVSLAAQDAEGAAIRGRFAAMIKGYQAQDWSAFSAAARETRTEIQGKIPSWSAEQGSVFKAETLYSRMHPFQISWSLYVLAAILLLFALVAGKEGKKSKTLGSIGWGALWIGFGIHIFGFGLRCYIAGRPPVTNMYESIVWVMLGVMVFAGIIYKMQKHPVVPIVAAALSALGLVAADAAPAMMDPGLHPLVPVLRSNFWLTVHVLTITTGYAAFALALGLGNVSLYHFGNRAPGSDAKANVMNQLTYRATQFGVVLLAAGTILGGVWADYSWGRFWGWDPKETWALIALLCYLILLHGRFAGWVGPFGFAVGSVVGFLSVLMAWYGVNFILGAGLHSYGFSSGGLGWVTGFTVLQLAYVAVISVRRKKKAVPVLGK